MGRNILKTEKQEKGTIINNNAIKKVYKLIKTEVDIC